MARTTPIRVKIITKRALDDVAKARGCDIPELLSRIAAGDLQSYADWQAAEARREKECQE